MKMYRVLLAINLWLSPHQVVPMLRGHVTEAITQTLPAVLSNHVPSVVKLDTATEAMNQRAIEAQRLKDQPLDAEFIEKLLEDYDPNNAKYQMDFDFELGSKLLQEHENSDQGVVAPSMQRMSRKLGDFEKDAVAPSPGLGLRNRKGNTEAADDTTDVTPPGQADMTRSYTEAEMAHIVHKARQLERGQDFLYMGFDNFVRKERTSCDTSGFCGRIRVYDEKNNRRLYQTGCCYCGGEMRSHYTSAVGAALFGIACSSASIVGTACLCAYVALDI